jgi:iron(III) transport system permease protein
MLLPYLTPILLVGYSYYNFSLSLVHHPLWSQAFYNLLLIFRLVPIAVLIFFFYPPTISPEAIYCHKLLQRMKSPWNSFTSSIAFNFRSSFQGIGVTSVFVFLLVFCEFELASLLGIGTWTVKLFDAQAGGIQLGESLLISALPIAIEATLLATVFVILYLSGRVQVQVNWFPTRRWWLKPMACAYIGTAIIVMTIIPSSIALGGVPEGFGIIFENFVLAKDIGASLVFAFAGALISYLAAGWLASHLLIHKKKKNFLLLTFLVSLPGLFGTLLLSLIILWLFQLPLFQAMYDTPLPLIIMLALYLLPYAIILHVLFYSLRPGESLHLASMLRSSPQPQPRRHASKILWDMKTKPLFWVAFILFWWAYFDLAGPAILSPSSMTPISVRLYNLMHYGQSSVLSAMVCTSFAVPLVIILALSYTRSLFDRLRWHE